MQLECVLSTTSQVFEEVSRFEIALRGSQQESQDLANFFDRGDITVVRVPARLDIMGGIADYSGSNVCEGTLERGVALGLQIRNDHWIRIRSLGLSRYNLATDFTLSLDNFYRKNGKLRDYSDMMELFTKDQRTSWSAYIVGAIFVLLKERKLHVLNKGLNIALISRVPIQVGIGSSATVEIATLHALNLALGLNLDGLALAKFGQITENKIVGAPCGIMDQIATVRGKANELTHILCQPDIVKGSISIPDEAEFVGINSMVRHNVAGPKYTNVRISTFMGRKIITYAMQRNGKLSSHDQLPYLCNLCPEEFENHYRNVLPEQISGDNFIKNYGDHDDPATQIDPKMNYPVRSRTSHPIYENDRVLKFIDLIQKANEDDGQDSHLRQAGKLMLASHQSYDRNCELSCAEVDLLVNIVKELGTKLGLYGAKITGGGSGGTVAVLGKKKTLRDAIALVVQKYQKETNFEPDVFWGSSPGALEFGCRKYRVSD
ncbi:hypothetical protein JXJ21_26830 [candidate division KSB1 bacterium]|nr:hypothetical protein [candidate division KSB1 bacterium]